MEDFSVRQQRQEESTKDERDAQRCEPSSQTALRRAIKDTIIGSADGRRNGAFALVAQDDLYERSAEASSWAVPIMITST